MNRKLYRLSGLVLLFFFAGCVPQQTGWDGVSKRNLPPDQPYAPPYDCITAQNPGKFSLSTAEIQEGAKKRDVILLTKVAVAMASGALKGKTDKDALTGFEAAAGVGNAFSQYEAGFRYYTGKTVKQDYRKGVQYFEMAAKQNYCMAQYMLADAYLKGNGVAKDIPTAIKYLDASARQGHFQGLHDMGHRLSSGDGVRADPRMSTAYFRSASILGYAPSMYAYGAHLMRGIGVSADVTEGAKWQLKAADLGESSGQFETGLNYIEGKGLPKDAQKGFKYLNSSANKGNHLAQYFLWSVFKENKDKETRDTVWGYLDSAARQGFPPAMLGKAATMAKEKKRTSKQNIEAYKWAMLSIMRGFKKVLNEEQKAEALAVADELEKRLSKADQEKAKKIIEAWKPGS